MPQEIEKDVKELQWIGSQKNIASHDVWGGEPEFIFTDDRIDPSVIVMQDNQENRDSFKEVGIFSGERADENAPFHAQK